MESFLRSVVGNGMQETAMIDLLLRKTLWAQRRKLVAGAGSRSQSAASAVPLFMLVWCTYLCKFGEASCGNTNTT